MSNRIEFYKNRSIGERFSVSVDFLKQNWKVLYKNILIGGLPLAIMMSYFLAQQMNVELAHDVSVFFIHYVFFFLISFLSMVYLYSMTGAVLYHYDRNQLSETTGWNDLKETFFRFSGKTVIISLSVYIPLIIFVVIFAAFSFVLGDFSSSGSQTLSIIVIIFFLILFIGGAIALTPSFTILYFPAYFSGKGNWESIKIAFKLGFKNWGSLFVTIILAGIVLYIIYMLFLLPFIFVAIFSMGQVTIFTYIFALLPALAITMIYPIMSVIFAFQYFSIVEKEEGVSLQSRVSEFENL